jgi:polysaccharide pyruvyl transferase WcaK-like protein
VTEPTMRRAGDGADHWVRSIFVDHSGYHLANVGDAAMLQMALLRLRERFPAARTFVFTYFPERLERLNPEAIPVFPRIHALARRGRLPKKAEYGLSQLWKIAAPRLPSLAPLARWLETRLPTREGRDLLPALAEADLVVAAGGGYLTDAFRPHALGVVSVLRTAQRLGRPTAMMGQGIGPIADGAFARSVADVLRRTDVLTLREGRAGPDHLARWGVPASRWTVTGDDAVELAHAERDARPRDAIGINIRVAPYANTTGTNGLTDTLALALSRLTRSTGAPYVALPISYHQEDADLTSIRRLAGDDLIVAPALEQWPLPTELAHEVARCRVVVTGSYHAAVFGASQGVPVVCLTRSGYYDQKFEGLQGLFGHGCTIVRLDGPDLEERVVQAVQRAWDEAPELRAALLAAAERQIALGRDAYDAIARLDGSAAS